jgi:predicted nucleic acid-binding protein
VSFVVDSGVLVDHLRDRPAATETVAEALRSGRRVAASVLTRIELRRAVQAHEMAAVEALEVLVEWVPVDHEIADIASEFAERHGRERRDLRMTDLVVAATAKRLQADLLSCDVQNFPMFPDLRPPY